MGMTRNLLFLLFFDSGSLVRHVYAPLLAVIVMGRLAMLLLEIICAPRQKQLRLLPMEDVGVQYLYRSLVMISWVLVVGLILSKWFERIGIIPVKAMDGANRPRTQTNQRARTAVSLIPRRIHLFKTISNLIG